MLQIHHGDLSQEALESLATQRLVACDTETTGLNWLVDELSLVQFFSPQSGGHLVRITPGFTATNIVSLMENSMVQKVFHHAPFDLAFFTANWKIDAHSILCTKIASKLISIGQPSDHTLQGLLTKYLGVEIPKGAVRTSNWGNEVLSPEQIEYALNDVKYLIPLLRELEKALAAQELLGLYRATCEYLPVRAKTDQRGLGDLFSY